METYQLDRILTWLSSAIGFNDKSERKYFYNKNEMLFFNLGFNDKIYYEWTNQVPLSSADRETIKSNLTQLYNDRTSFIEISRSDKQFNLFPTNPSPTIAEYEDKEKAWTQLYSEVQNFLDKNRIDINKTRLIE